MKFVKACLLVVLLAASLVSCDLIATILNLTPKHDNPNDPEAPVAAPVLSPSEGTVAYGTLVAMTSATADAEIRYATGDGTQADPTPTTGIPYADSSRPVITASITFKARAFKTGRTPSATTTISYALTAVPSVEAPVFDPPGGTYISAQSVSITCATAGAAIRYTTDASDPRTSSTAQAYTASIPIGSTTTIKAFAIKSGLADSGVASAIYTINLPGQTATPGFSPAGGFYTAAQSVAISCATTGARILYTVDSSDPRESGSALLYSSAVSVASSMTLKAYAYKGGLLDSGVGTAEYTLQAAAPTFDPPEGSYASVTAVTIASTTAGAAIKYTIDATDPRTSTSAIPYSVPVSLSATTVLKAYASKAGMADSNTTTAVYSITLPQVATPSFTPNGGPFDTPKDVTITSTPGAIIRFTTDNSDPRTISNANAQIYSGSIPISTSTVLKAYAYKAGMRDSEIGFAYFVINLVTSVATPTFNLPAGIYLVPQTVSISCSTPGAEIRYTTDGNDPTVSSPAYSSLSPLTVSTTTTVKAFAAKSGLDPSGIATASYIFQVASPGFSLAPGSYTSIQSVSLTSSTPGAQILYTTDGSDPGTSATAATYASPVSLSTSTVLKAIGRKTGMSDSAVVTAVYGITLPQVDTPSFTPSGGTFTAPQSVTITSTSGAAIRYTIDGSDPRESATVQTYMSPIAVSSTTTLKAYATMYGYTDSPVAVGTYMVTGKVVITGFSPLPGIYAASQNVSIGVSPVDATIRYTTDGTTFPSSSTGTVYAGAFPVSASTTVIAFAYKSDWEDSALLSGTYTITGTVAAPVFSPQPDTYVESVTVAMSSTTSGATIRYTTDGTDPKNSGTAVEYTGGVTLTTTATLRAYAYRENWTDSAVTAATYVVTGTVAAPGFSPAAGMYSAPQNVGITTATANASIYYTTDGSTPNATTGTLYGGPVALSAFTTLKAIAYRSDWTDSTVSAGDFQIVSPALYALNGSLATHGLAMKVLPIVAEDSTGTYRDMTLTSFGLSDTEITQGDYTAVMGSNPASGHGVGADYPVYFVSWFNAATFCNTLSTLLGYQPVYNETTWEADFTKNGFYLPTEAQWEYAAGGPNHYMWSLGNTFIGADYVWNTTGNAPVKSRRANGFGLYGMSASCWDWCNDWFGGTYPYTGQTDPNGPASGTQRTVRGGGWDNWESTSPRCTTRNPLDPSGVTDGNKGFHVALGGHRQWGPIAAPQFSLAEGTYVGARAVTITAIPAGASIRYTMDGSTPSSTVGTPYTGPVTVASPLTLKAVACKSGLADSPVASAVYTITHTYQTVNDLLAAHGVNLRAASIIGSGSMPYRDMTLTAYAISETEVTQGDYQAVMGSNPASGGTHGVGPDYPVYLVSWYDGVRFCNALSTRCGLQPVYNESTWAADFTKNGFYLPTDAQWEYAAGGPNHYTWPQGNTFNSADYVCYTTATGTVKGKAANGFGVYGMAGNVWEWCHDWYGGSFPYTGQTDPNGPASGTDRVFRGGGFDNDSVTLRCTNRSHLAPSNGSSENQGFRVAVGGHGLW